MSRHIYHFTTDLIVVDGPVDQTSVHCPRGSVVFGCYSDLVRPTVNVNTKDASSGATACVCLSVFEITGSNSVVAPVVASLVHVVLINVHTGTGFGAALR
jgi:hypothetical protein